MTQVNLTGSDIDNNRVLSRGDTVNWGNNTGVICAVKQLENGSSEVYIRSLDGKWYKFTVTDLATGDSSTGINRTVDLSNQLSADQIATHINSIIDSPTAENLSRLDDIAHDQNGLSAEVEIADNQTDSDLEAIRANYRRENQQILDLMATLESLGLVETHTINGQRRFVRTEAFTAWINANGSHPSFQTMQRIYNRLDANRSTPGIYSGQYNRNVANISSASRNEVNPLSRTIAGIQNCTFSVVGSAIEIRGGPTNALLYRVTINANGTLNIRRANGGAVSQQTQTQINDWLSGVIPNRTIVQGNQQRTFWAFAPDNIRIGNRQINDAERALLAPFIRSLTSPSAQDIEAIRDTDGDETSSQSNIQTDYNNFSAYKNLLDNTVVSLNSLLQNLPASSQLNIQAIKQNPNMFNMLMAALSIATGRTVTEANFDQEWTRFRSGFNNDRQALTALRDRVLPFQTKINQRMVYLERREQIRALENNFNSNNYNDIAQFNLTLADIDALYQSGQISSSQRNNLRSSLIAIAERMEQRLRTNPESPDNIRMFPVLMSIHGSNSSFANRYTLNGNIQQHYGRVIAYIMNNNEAGAIAYLQGLCGGDQRTASIIFNNIKAVINTPSAQIQNRRRPSYQAIATIQGIIQTSTDPAVRRRCEIAIQLIQLRGMNMPAAALNQLVNYARTGQPRPMLQKQGNNLRIVLGSGSSAVQLGISWPVEVARRMMSLPTNLDADGLVANFNSEGNQNLVTARLQTAINYCMNDLRATTNNPFNYTQTDYGSLSRIYVETTTGDIQHFLSLSTIQIDNNTSLTMTNSLRRRVLDTSTYPPVLILQDFDNNREIRIPATNISGGGLRFGVLDTSNQGAYIRTLMQQYRRIADDPAQPLERRNHARLLLAILRRQMLAVPPYSGQGSDVDPIGNR